MSSRPSSGSASSNTRTPANSAPTLPARMQLAEPLNQGLWSTVILAVNGGVRKLFAPVHRYEARPSRSFRPPSAPRIMSASNPAPAMTANRSSFILIASIRRRRPRSPVVTAPSMSPGTPRLVASRLAVPAGTMAIAASVPASTSTDRCAMPSPPQTKNRSAPSPSSRLICLGARRLLSTSAHSGSSTPCSASVRRSCGRPPSMLLPAWATTATRVMRRPSARGRRRRRHAPQRSQRAATRCRPGPRRPHRSGGACRGTSGSSATSAGIAMAIVQHGDPDPSAADARGDQQRDAAVHGDRRGRVPGVVAGVGRQIVEPRHVRPLRGGSPRSRRGMWPPRRRSLRR